MLKSPRTLFVAILAAIALAIPGHALAQNYPPSVGQYVAAAKKQVKTIKMDEFKMALAKKDVGILVDVREPDEYADGHIPGAINVPRGLIEFTIWTHIGFPDKTDTAARLTLYCKTGGRCSLAARSLQELGLTNVTSVDMKLEDWVKAGNTLVK